MYYKTNDFCFPHCSISFELSIITSHGETHLTFESCQTSFHWWWNLRSYTRLERRSEVFIDWVLLYLTMKLCVQHIYHITIQMHCVWLISSNPFNTEQYFFGSWSAEQLTDNNVFYQHAWAQPSELLTHYYNYIKQNIRAWDVTTNWIALSMI